MGEVPGLPKNHKPQAKPGEIQGETFKHIVVIHCKEE